MNFSNCYERKEKEEEAENVNILAKTKYLIV